MHLTLTWLFVISIPIFRRSYLTTGLHCRRSKGTDYPQYGSIPARYEIGEKVYLPCKKESNLLGIKVLECQENGKWKETPCAFPEKIIKVRHGGNKKLELVDGEDETCAVPEGNVPWKVYLRKYVYGQIVVEVVVLDMLLNDFLPTPEHLYVNITQEGNCKRDASERFIKDDKPYLRYTFGCYITGKAKEVKLIPVVVKEFNLQSIEWCEVYVYRIEDGNLLEDFSSTSNESFSNSHTSGMKSMMESADRYKFSNACKRNGQQSPSKYTVLMYTLPPGILIFIASIVIIILICVKRKKQEAAKKTDCNADNFNLYGYVNENRDDIPSEIINHTLDLEPAYVDGFLPGSYCKRQLPEEDGYLVPTTSNGERSFINNGKQTEIENSETNIYFTISEYTT